ncbi:MAG: hypothetical protein ACJ0SL_00875, partial [Candidatus Rariloculaceae bacterium]
IDELARAVVSSRISHARELLAASGTNESPQSILLPPRVSISRTVKPVANEIARCAGIAEEVRLAAYGNVVGTVEDVAHKIGAGAIHPTDE